MTISLHNLHPNPGSTKEKKRLGRGRGSGKGKTSGKGVKGQKARPGHHGARLAFEGGQVPMPRRIPKRGFKAPNRIPTFAVNLSTLEKLFDNGATVDLETLRNTGLVPKSIERVKVLGEGTISKKLIIKVHAASEAAKAKITAAGGSFEEISMSVASAEA